MKKGREGKGKEGGGERRRRKKEKGERKVVIHGAAEPLCQLKPFYSFYLGSCCLVDITGWSIHLLGPTTATALISSDEWCGNQKNKWFQCCSLLF